MLCWVYLEKNFYLLMSYSSFKIFCINSSLTYPERIGNCSPGIPFYFVYALLAATRLIIQAFLTFYVLPVTLTKNKYKCKSVFTLDAESEGT